MDGGKKSVAQKESTSSPDKSTASSGKRGNRVGTSQSSWEGKEPLGKKNNGF